jgi:transposase
VHAVAPLGLQHLLAGELRALGYPARHRNPSPARVDRRTSEAPKTT